MAELKTQIKELLVETLFLADIQATDIGDDDNLQETLNVDSVALFQVVAGIEEAFGIRLEDTDFDAERFSTVNGIAEVVAGKLGHASG